ncbi:MAG: ABC transporter substrate-binding protein [Bacteroidota bacterium]|jgi:iron complex transport system substrate-binding protein
MIITDQLGRKVHLNSPAKRIVSLVPSQTELLFDLGLDAEVIGITKFCIHPENWLQEKTIVGGTKNFHIDKIKALQPDLIIANKEENTKELIEELALDYPVYISDVNNIEDALQMIADVGSLIGKSSIAEALISDIKNSRNDLSSINQTKKSCYYFIWKNPWLTVGGDTFINTMIDEAGFVSLSKNQTRYPEIDLDNIDKHPDFLLLSSEPYPFKQEDAYFLQTKFPSSKILFVDGTYFSWYGSRMKYTFQYLANLQKSSASN